MWKDRSIIESRDDILASIQVLTKEQRFRLEEV